ncbi:MAG: hypothetical protein WC769_04245 [Thermodesulfovibrionales bacterium]|jgi:hypothetical protein
MNIIETIQKSAQNDAELRRLFEKVQENAELYLLAKQRQKGCDGMGEVVTLKDEFIYALNEIIRHCNEKGYLSGDISYETDSIARDICKIQPE